ncbi:hypothetical protein [Sinimarinibacterium flocculans]|uniref:hypothetical protein n=2 Tax=Sinimarinibacterium flocculans TaxID=985250 RepID=UPI0011B6C348|nr:hypothetical protein [Sinimarinibacterium flocculans]
MGLKAMKVVISAPKRDQGTAHIAEAMHAPLRQLSAAVSGEYGGNIEHLWVELELVPSDADRRSAWSFRFQKRVSPRSLAAELPKAEYHNVGHYSVRPDYFALAAVAPEKVSRYLMELIYESTAVLEKRQKQLGGFNVEGFRVQMRQAIEAVESSR